MMGDFITAFPTMLCAAVSIAATLLWMRSKKDNKRAIAERDHYKEMYRCEKFHNGDNGEKLQKSQYECECLRRDFAEANRRLSQAIIDLEMERKQSILLSSSLMSSQQELATAKKNFDDVHEELVALELRFERRESHVSVENKVLKERFDSEHGIVSEIAKSMCQLANRLSSISTPL